MLLTFLAFSPKELLLAFFLTLKNTGAEGVAYLLSMFVALDSISNTLPNPPKNNTGTCLEQVRLPGFPKTLLFTGMRLYKKSTV